MEDCTHRGTSVLNEYLCMLFVCLSNWFKTFRNALHYLHASVYSNQSMLLNIHEMNFLP